MLNSIPPHKTKSWQRLTDHYEEIKGRHMRDLFAEDALRFENFSLALDDMLVDFSKNRITEQTLDLLTRLAEENALALSAGHSFVLVLGPGLYPINVLNQIKMVPEVCRIFCATSNPLQVIVAQSEQGRGILGVIDGVASKGIESAEDVQKRRELLRMIGYKQ